MSYWECARCGAISDDGAFIPYEGRYYHVCMDCSDEMDGMNKEQVNKIMHDALTSGK